MNGVVVLEWRDIRIPLSSVTYLAGWNGAPACSADVRPDRRLVKNVRIRLAKECIPEAAWTSMQAVEVSSVTIE